MLTEDEFVIQLHKYVLRRDKHGQPVVRWWFDFRGQRVVLTTAQLLSQQRFRHTVFQTILELPPRRAPQNFDMWLDRLVQNAITDSPPPEAV